MNDALSLIANAWQQTSGLECVSVVFGLIYVLLAARENIWCWPAAFIGTATAVFLFWDASLLMESGLNIYYLLMAIFGWWQWQYATPGLKKIQIHRWRLSQHVTALVLISILSLSSGYILSNNSTAALPYLDSFTTWSALVTTWMVARKVLENWLYWIVIDAISIFIYIDRGLYLYALLFMAYTIIAFFGFVQWRSKLKQIETQSSQI